MKFPHSKEHFSQSEIISFESLDTEFEIENPDKLKAWISDIVSEHNQDIQHITYQFTSDRKIHEINLEFLNHDYPTDIITFPLDDGENGLYADIFISIDTVNNNAKEYSNSFPEELLRVIIHGVLHLLGYDDHSDEDRKAMRKAEDKAIEKYGIDG